MLDLSQFQTQLQLGIIALQLQLSSSEDYIISQTIGLISLAFFTSIQIFYILLLNDIAAKIFSVIVEWYPCEKNFVIVE